MRSSAAVAVILLALVSCTDDEPTNSEGQYCAAAQANAAALTGAHISTAADTDAVLALYSEMHAKAPLAIEPEWGAMEALIRAAKELDPGDAAATAQFAERARQTKEAADRIIIYTQQKCQVLIGDVPVQSVPLVPQPTEVDPSAPSTTG